MFALKPEDFIIYLKKVAKVIEENKEYITELDSETGDGDHWLNMNIGFQKLVEKTGEWKQMNFQELFQNIAMVLISFWKSVHMLQKTDIWMDCLCKCRFGKISLWQI